MVQYLRNLYYEYKYWGCSHEEALDFLWEDIHYEYDGLELSFAQMFIKGLET